MLISSLNASIGSEFQKTYFLSSGKFFSGPLCVFNTKNCARFMHCSSVHALVLHFLLVFGSVTRKQVSDSLGSFHSKTDPASVRFSEVNPSFMS